MPAALDVDWTAIQTHYIAGVRVRHLAEQYGINPLSIMSRAKRLKWSQHRAKHVTLLALKTISDGEKSLKQRGLAVLAELQNDVELSVKTAKTLPKPKKWTDMDVKERAMKSLTERAMRTAGLDQPGSLTLISIDRLSVQTHGQNDSDMSPIDIETVEKTPETQ